MGGPGSGRGYNWRRNARKTTVEECLRLNASQWTKAGIITAGIRQSGGWQWTYSSGNRFSISYDLTTLDIDAASVRVWYSWTLTGERQVHSADYAIGLTATRPHLGGLRWWFTCPLVIDGRPCRRRVAKLYLPSLARYFGCRQCHDLTYTSCQESHKDDAFFRRMASYMSSDFATVRDLLKSTGRTTE